MNNLLDSKILVVDDEHNIRQSLKIILEHEGATVSEADSVAAAKAMLSITPQSNKTIDFDLVLLDLGLPDGNGLDILQMIQSHGKSIQVIVISGEGTTEIAFQATQMGAFDYIEKPFSTKRIQVSANRALAFNNLSKNLAKSSKRTGDMLGEHPKFLEIVTLLEKVAPTNGRVLITGESGTGKELIAKAIHLNSPRSNLPMIKVNCAAIPRGLMESELFGHEKGAFTGATKARLGVFERAHGGTLFLDEIAELTPDLQAKLLRVLQSGEFTRVGSEKTCTTDIRLIAATNRDLKELIHSGEFREDLYYRLNVVTIHSPSLRERLSDVPLLANHFLKVAVEDHSLGNRQFSKNALDELMSYNWPGNIRELKNVVERAAILSQDTYIEHFENLACNESKKLKIKTSATPINPAEKTSPSISMAIEVMPWEQFHETVDREFLKFIMKNVKGNVSEASRVLELERAYVHRLLKKLGIQREGVQ